VKDKAKLAGLRHRLLAHVAAAGDAAVSVEQVRCRVFCIELGF
jgi:hypothetical protein